MVGIKSQTVKKMVAVLKETEIKKKIKGGRKNKLSIEQRLFMILEYWKEYNTYGVIAKRYDISQVRIQVAYVFARFKIFVFVNRNKIKKIFFEI